MARPIDANALHAEISKWPESVMYKDWVQSAIANAPTLTPPNEWVSVEDELPARDGIYLVYTTRGSVTTAHFYAEKIFRDDYKRKASWQGNRNVTHWMPLPTPPDSRPPEVRT